MEVLTVSQKTLTELSSLESISTDEITNLCKYFLQAILRGQVMNEIGNSYLSYLFLTRYLLYLVI